MIIDEIGNLPIEKQGSNLFIQLIAKRYEKHSTIITANNNFNKWGDVFSDNVIANAILDRLLHHSTVIPIHGTSYRIKDKVQEIETKGYFIQLTKTYMNFLAETYILLLTLILPNPITLYTDNMLYV